MDVHRSKKEVAAEAGKAEAGGRVRLRMRVSRLYVYRWKKEVAVGADGPVEARVAVEADDPVEARVAVEVDDPVYAWVALEL